MPPHCAFERELSVQDFDLSALAFGFGGIPWAEFVLNPRRLRGSDFLMRWSQGVWSEHRIVEAIKQGGRFTAIPYGPSGVAPEGDPRAFELYFERLEAAGLGAIKRPDLLVIRAADRPRAEVFLERMGGASELPFRQEKDLSELLSLAVVAIECETSLWKAEKMPAFGRPLRVQRRSGLLGAPKNAVMPTVIVKDEDRAPLAAWESANQIPIHIWHVFYDRAYGLARAELERLITSGQVEPTRQVFQAPGGSTTAKVIFKAYYHYAYAVGTASSEPHLLPDFIEDKNGHILPYVRFEGGSLHLDADAENVLAALESERWPR
jgi:hypothetical protein